MSRSSTLFPAPLRPMRSEMRCGLICDMEKRRTRTCIAARRCSEEEWEREREREREKNGFRLLWWPLLFPSRVADSRSGASFNGGGRRRGRASQRGRVGFQTAQRELLPSRGPLRRLQADARRARARELRNRAPGREPRGRGGDARGPPRARRVAPESPRGGEELSKPCAAAVARGARPRRRPPFAELAAERSQGSASSRCGAARAGRSRRAASRRRRGRLVRVRRGDAVNEKTLLSVAVVSLSLPLPARAT